ncbi:MAG TPA: hypothetical protein VF319_12040 [Caldimonas sp.]
MRRLLVMLWLLVGSIVSAEAQVSVSIGINLPSYPTLVAVPGYPVYYAPRANANYFFYDGMYWVYQGDNWYASSWYNGPWWLVGAEEVPLYVLRVPVRYYRQPPAYFRGWRADAPPRWGEHWGNEWDQRHRGWDQWDRRAAPPPAPLPLYQKQYSGNRYPRPEQQPVLQSRNYRYQPRDAVVQQHYQARQAPGALAPPVQARRAEPPRSVSTPPDQRGVRRPPQVPQAAPAAPRGAPREGGVQQPPAVRPPAPAAPPHQVRQPERPPREQAARQAQPVTAPHEQPARQAKPAVVPSEQHARPPQESAAPRGQQAQQAQPPRGEQKGRGKSEEKGQGKGEEKGRGER